MKKINYKEKGITLVALVITIIILLILAGVTLSTALSENGLFRMAKKAVNEYQESEKQEQTALGEIAEEMDKISIDYNDYVGCYVEGYEPTKKVDNDPFVIKNETSGVESDKDESDNQIENVETNGDQKFTTESLGWRIWDYDNYTKTIRLISDKPTETTLTLKGATGYNNGVWAINEICRQCYGQYDENGQMKKGISVANLRRSDIQKVSTYDYTQYKHNKNGDWIESENVENVIYFGGCINLDNVKCPKMWEEYDSKWTYEYNGTIGSGSDKECEMWERENEYKIENGINTENNKSNFKESYYYHIYEKSQFINGEYYNLLFGSRLDMGYWLSGRYMHLSESGYVLGLNNVTGRNKLVSGWNLTSSSGVIICKSEFLRPIVSINLRTSDYNLEKIENDGKISFKLK